jgi:hypothetical protein
MSSVTVRAESVVVVSGGVIHANDVKSASRVAITDIPLKMHK